MKKLPIGIQSFKTVRENDYVYVDKTQHIHKIATSGKYYFLSRPRRFGKSLLISTFKELFRGNKTLFQGLWIENEWDWTKENPVIHISFDATDYQGLGLEKAISYELVHNAKQYNIDLPSNSFKTQFRELIEQLSKKQGKVVVLIDEYDKPIIDYLENDTIKQAKANQAILKRFYSILKNADEFIELVFIAGVSKFSKVSLFSDLNNLKDITLEENYATIVGYTQKELELYFEHYLSAIEQKLTISREKLFELTRYWYNGYSWDGEQKVYNPFGMLNFFNDKRFQNYWFATGSPRFLIKQMKKHAYFDVENSLVNNTLLERYDLDNIELVPLLFQTGYLTVKTIDWMTGDMLLDYPNKEVRESMYQFLIDDLSENPRRLHTGLTIKDLNEAFLSRNLDKIRDIINGLLADLPYEAYQNQSEGFYHGLLHLIFSYLGMFIQSEPHLSRGRADVIVQTLTDVFIFEFKFNKTAIEALEQIKKQGYADKYRPLNKIITGIGVNFSEKNRKIDDWIPEVL